jgi:tripartite-type tricarboxylate transporter receptor subunit TctC
MSSHHPEWRRLERRACALAVAILILVGCGPGLARAQAYPAKAITINSSLGPGSSYDPILRIVQEDWQTRLGKTLIVNPVVGGLGTLAPASLLRAAPDGYTIALVYAAPITLSPQMMTNPPYDPIKDFAPVTLLTRHGLLYVAAPNFPANNFTELIAQAKANPGKISVGYAGAGSLVHVLQISQAMDVQFLPVPYKSSTQLAPALMGGELAVAVHTVGAVEELLRAGRLKALFIGSRNRSPEIPNVPSISEYKQGIEGVSWFAVMAPAGTPKDRVDWLAREFGIAMKTPKMAQLLKLSAYDLVTSTPEELAEVIKAEIPAYTKIVKQYNIKAE